MTVLRLVASIALLYASSFTAAAGPIFFGNYAPLTNTRYGAQPGVPQLVATGRETLLVWATPSTVRVARLADGEKRVAQLVMEAYQRDFDAVWTGKNVLVAATHDGYSNALMGRLVDVNGSPVGDVFQIQASAFRPRLASNGQRNLLLYMGTNGLHLAVLSPNGREVLSDVFISPSVDDYDVASNGSGFMVLTASDGFVRALTYDANGTSVSSTTLAGVKVGNLPREAAITSDGDDYLAVWTEANNVWAAEVSSAGTPSSAVAIENAGTSVNAAAPAVVWAGDHYEASYRAAAEVRVLNVNEGALVAQRISTVPASDTTRTSLAHADGRTRIAWTSQGTGLIRVRDTNAAGEGENASFGATEQFVMAAATNSASTMYVWNEVGDDASRTYIGFRDRQGSWIERAIGTNLDRTAIAASNGTDFMVVTRNATDWLAYRINANGTVSGQAVKIATRANVRDFSDITWNSKHYVLAGVDSSGRAIAATLTTGAIMNPLVVVRTPLPGFETAKPAVASDGTNTLMAWQEMKATACFPICDFVIDGINAQLLGPDLQLLGESAVMVIDNDANEPHVVWSTEYTIVWSQQPSNESRGSVMAQRMGRDGKRAGPAFTISERNHAPFYVDAIGLSQGYALTWTEWVHDIAETHIALLRPDGTIQHETTLPATKMTSAVFALLPDLRFAHAFTRPQLDPPHHGASRIVLAVGDLIPPVALPGAPVLSVRGTSTTAELTWSPPNGVVNGYRLEYRVGDGAWNELDRFHGPEQTTASIRLSGNRKVTFRVRAFNDAGAGPYSPIAGIGGSKRRVVTVP